MLNEQSAVNDFICVSSNVMSVVDYCIIPHEIFHMVKNVCVRRVLYVYDAAGEVGKEDPSCVLPDHSILTWYMNLLGTHASATQTSPITARTVFDLSLIDAAFSEGADGKLLLENINSQLDSVDSEGQLHACYKHFC